MRHFLFLSLFIVLSGYGETSYPEVSEITVKTSARDSLSAKQKALSIATERAFNKLIDINFPEATRLKGKLSFTQLRDCVYDYSIEQEKFSGTVYIAEFSFRFAEDKLLKLFRFYGISEPETKAKILKMTIYTKDYLDNPKIFKDVSIHSFSREKMTISISSEFKKRLKEKNIKFAEINA